MAEGRAHRGMEPRTLRQGSRAGRKAVGPTSAQAGTGLRAVGLAGVCRAPAAFAFRAMFSKQARPPATARRPSARVPAAPLESSRSRAGEELCGRGHERGHGFVVVMQSTVHGARVCVENAFPSPPAHRRLSARDCLSATPFGSLPSLILRLPVVPSCPFGLRRSPRPASPPSRREANDWVSASPRCMPQHRELALPRQALRIIPGANCLLPQGTFVSIEYA